MTRREDALPGGKLPPDLLAAVLAPLAPRDGRVRVGPRVGEDAAVIDLDDRLLVAAADPITFATDEIGRYVVAVNANDIAVRGATPRWLLATVLLPRGTTSADVRALMADLAAACRALAVDLIGGHTEVTDAVTRPPVAGVMLGEVESDHLVTTGGARPGDALVLGGALAIEGTAVLARQATPTLRARGVPADTLDRARALLDTPGISIVAMARAVCDAVRPHALHDPTEGGLATALAELAAASGAGVHLEAPGSLPVLPETRAVCAALDLNPLGLLASGALLVAVAPVDVAASLRAGSRRSQPTPAVGRSLPTEGVAVRPRGPHHVSKRLCGR